MGLNTFGWSGAEVIEDRASGRVVAGVSLTVYTDLTKTTQVTALYGKDGVTAIPSGVLVSDSKGRFGFKASDAYSLLYVWDGTTEDPWPVAAHEALDGGAATHAQAVADAQAAADSAAASASNAQTAANLVGAPADNAIAAAVNGSASQTNAALSATYAAQWKPATAYAAGAKVITPDGLVAKAATAFTSASTFNSTNWIYGTDPAAVPTIKTAGDGRASVWEFTHNDTTGYLYHLLAGAGFGGTAAILAIGNDNGTGTSILLPNKAGGRAIVGDQRATVTATNAYWMHATQRSPGSSLVRLEMQADNAATVLELLAFGTPGATQNLLYVGDPAGEAGTIRAASGQIEWARSILIRDKSGSAASYLDVTENNGVAANTRQHTLVRRTGVEFYSYSGSAGQWWPFAMVAGGSGMNIQAGGLTSTVGTPGALGTLISIKSGKLGFFGVGAISQPARVGAITDSSGGTSGGSTVAAVTDVATAANAIATLIAKINSLEAKLSGAAGGLGLTA